MNDGWQHNQDYIEERSLIFPDPYLFVLLRPQGTLKETDPGPDVIFLSLVWSRQHREKDHAALVIGGY